MKKYYIDAELLREIIENPVRGCYKPGGGLLFTSRITGEQIYLGALEDRKNEQINGKSTIARTKKSRGKRSNSGSNTSTNV